MISQLVDDLAKGQTSKEAVQLALLRADALDLVLRAEEVWESFRAKSFGPSAGPARGKLIKTGQFAGVKSATCPPWDHLASSFVLESTRIVQILSRVLREYRYGESLGVPPADLQTWLNATETLLSIACLSIPFTSKSVARSDPEATRRNAYWRLFGMDLPFGSEDNAPAVYPKASEANLRFPALFEHLLSAVLVGIKDVEHAALTAPEQQKRIFDAARELQAALVARRQQLLLYREELFAATILGWAELSLSRGSPLVLTLEPQSTGPAEALQGIGQRVGMPAHSRSAAMFSLSHDLSTFLRTIEASMIMSPSKTWILYAHQKPTSATSTDPAPIGNLSKRVAGGWQAATGRSLPTL